MKFAKNFSKKDVFPRKNLLMHLRSVHASNPDEFKEEEIPPPPGARSADEESKYLPENMDPKIHLKFPDRIRDMDKGIWFPDDTLLNPGYIKKNKWDI